MKKKRRLINLLSVCLLSLILIAMIILSFKNSSSKATDEVFSSELTKNLASEEPQPVSVEKDAISSQIAEKNTLSQVSEIAPKPVETVKKPKIAEKEPKTLQEIFFSRRGWNPKWPFLYHKLAPDFEFEDINGKIHKLSDYRGKDVLLVFWGTWCRYCVYSIPDLIKFRNEVPEEELAILGLSNERPSTIRQFAAKNKINYIVFSKHPYALPSPYNSVQGLPFNVFIDKQGKVKTAAEGALPIEDVKAIIKAKR